MAAAGAGDSGLATAAKQGDCRVAQGSHHLRDAAGAHLGVVFTEGHVPYVVGAVLDDPVIADAVKYWRAILPLVALGLLNCVVEPTKSAVLAEHDAYSS
jgi:hypothetical protein